MNILFDLNSPMFHAPFGYGLFQSSLAGFLAFVISFFGIKYFLYLVKKKGICTQPIRTDGPESHLKTKKNTPTMGGMIIVLGTVISTLVMIKINNYILITLLVFLSFAAIGFVDDYMKVTGRGTKGLKGSIKLVIQFFIIGIALLWLQATDAAYSQTAIAIPFSSYSIDIGILYIFFATLVIVGSANAANLTDGLDGLVSMPAIINLFCLIFLIYAVSNQDLAAKLGVTHIQNIGSLITLCAILIGSITAFLLFNKKPAKLFMGDVGSLPIGGALGTIAIILKQEIVFGIITFLFVAEAMSVIIQVASYKLRKKRIFLMAPLHHHFEKKGWSEKKVVHRFWLASFIFSLIGTAGFIL